MDVLLLSGEGAVDPGHRHPGSGEGEVTRGVGHQQPHAGGALPVGDGEALREGGATVRP